MKRMLLFFFCTFSLLFFAASTQKQSVSGTYQEEDDNGEDGCHISLSVIKDSTGYRYRLNTTTHRYEGKLRLTLNPDHTTSLILEGIPYSDYKKGYKKPLGIEGLISEDVLMIQNYGNAMNPYTQLSECSLKYIRLVRN